MAGSLVLLASVLLGACVLWFVADPVKYALVDAQRAGRPLQDAALDALAGFGVLQWAMIAAAAGSVLATLWVEWRSRAISTSLWPGSRYSTAVTLTAVLLWFGHAYLYPGHLLSGDTGAHITRIAHFARGLADGTLLYWDNYFYGGATFLQFTGPLFFWLGGGVAWLVGDAVLATKVVLFALHLASGWSLYWLLRSYGSARAASVIGAVVYAGAFAHLHLILYKGALPQSIVLALLPLMFLAADRMARAERLLSAGWAATAVLVAALVAAHQPHGFVAGLYLAAYILASLALGRYRPVVLHRAATAAVFAALMASFAVVPWVAEADQTMVYDQPKLLYWEWPDGAYFSRLLTWANTWTTPGTPSVAYVGLSSAALAIVAIVLARPLRGAPELRRLGAIFTALLLVSLGLRADHLRDIIFTLLAIAVLSGLGAAALLALRPGWGRLAMVLVAIVMLDIGGTAVQPLARRDKGYLESAAAYLSNLETPRRAVLVHTYEGDGALSGLTSELGASGGPLNYQSVQTLSGPHNLAATLFHNYDVAVLKRVERSLQHSGALSPDVEALLAMLNVGYVINDDGRQMGMPAEVETAVVDGPLGRALRIDHATPVVFAPRLVEIAPLPQLDKPMLWSGAFGPPASVQAREVDGLLSVVLDAMALDPRTATAAAIPVRSLSQSLVTPVEQATPSSATRQTLGMIDYQLSVDRVALRIALSDPGFVQLAHAWYPFQTVTVDGIVVPALQGTLNLIVLPMEAGEHLVEIRAQRSILRTATGSFSAALFALGVGMMLWPRRRAPR